MSTLKTDFLPYGRQLIEEDDIAAVTAVLRGDWLTTGPAVEGFEAALCETTASNHAIACSNGTAALHMAALALGLGPGDTAIVPSVTFLATANAVRLTGAEVVFADCDPDSGLMEAQHLAEALARAKGKVKAVFPVHMAGQCADLAAIRELAEHHGVAVIDDAAHAIGSRYRLHDGETYPIGDGRLTTMTTFSFHPVKTIAMGEGGAVTTNDETLAKRLRQLRSHGMTRSFDEMQNSAMAYDNKGLQNPWYYEMPEIGLNYRVTDIQCALGLSQLGKLERFVNQRRSLAAGYDRLLAGLDPIIQPLAQSQYCKAAWHLYVVLIDFAAAGISRAELMGRLRDDDIGTQVHYIPVHQQPYYQDRCGDAALDGAERYYSRTLSLPLFAAMTEADVERVVVSLKRNLGL